MQVLRFWEVLWSGHLSRQFHVYCAAAVLERHRRTIMERDLDFDGLLKCANLWQLRTPACFTSGSFCRPSSSASACVRS